MTDAIPLGVVGCGRVVEYFHAPAVLRAPAWRVTDLADPDPARLAWAAAVFVGARHHGDIESLLRDGVAEAVLVATPAACHAADVEAALRRGRSVLVEKPLATMVPDAEQLAARQAATGLTVAVGFNRRFRGSYRGLRDRLQASRAPGPSRIAHTLITDAARWRRRAADGRSGLDALLDDVPPHQADLVTWLFGRPICRVRVTRQEVGTAGHLLHYELSLADGPTVHCCAGHGASYLEELALDGRVVMVGGDLAALGRPVVLARALGSGLAAVRAAWSRATGQPSPSRASFEGQLAAFAATIRGAVTDLADVAAGLRACRAVDGCRRSVALGGAWVNIANREEQHA